MRSLSKVTIANSTKGDKRRMPQLGKLGQEEGSMNTSFITIGEPDCQRYSLGKIPTLPLPFARTELTRLERNSG